MRLVDSPSSPFRFAGTGTGTSFFACVTASVCYAEQGGGQLGNGLERTSDGGAHWRLVSPLPDHLTLSQDSNWLSCATASVCTGAVGGLKLARTSDGGAHWSIESVPAPPGISGASIGQLSCPTAAKCVLSVAGHQGGTFLSTSNGGTTWQVASRVPQAAQVTDLWTLRCDAGGSCIGLTLTGPTDQRLTALRSADGGRTWAAEPSTGYPTGPILLMTCGDALHCMMVTFSRQINMTTTSDCGATWRVTTAPRAWPTIATDLSCPTGQDCFIAAADPLPPVHGVSNGYDNPVIEATHDGGETWTPLSLPTVKGSPLALVYPLSCPSGDGCIGVAATARQFAGGQHRVIISSFPGPG